MPKTYCRTCLFFSIAILITIVSGLPDRCKGTGVENENAEDKFQASLFPLSVAFYSPLALLHLIVPEVTRTKVGNAERNTCPPSSSFFSLPHQSRWWSERRWREGGGVSALSTLSHLIVAEVPEGENGNAEDNFMLASSASFSSSDFTYHRL